MIYYVDEKNGDNSHSGLSQQTPIKDYSLINAVEGDTILFKRGSFYRDALDTVEGVGYGAWGEGEKPTFCGSVDASAHENWESIGDNLWRYTKSTKGKVGNIVFDDGFGTFRWEKHELTCQGDFWDSRQADENAVQIYDKEELIMYSKSHPSEQYSHIELCHYGKRVLGYIKSGNTFDSLRFVNSGVHGLAGQGKNVTVRNCDFENIGGVMFYKNRKIRFGNGIEFWQYGEDILIENCTFNQIYDSCITHQGNHATVTPAKNMICRGNTFNNYSMAAFEYRDRLPIASSFENNICTNAGCGFGVQGEDTPRRSEIYPQPMGHHIFLWRIDKESENGSLVIKDNHFGSAPHGFAVYSIINPEREAQIRFDNNTYVDNSRWHFNGKDEYIESKFKSLYLSYDKNISYESAKGGLNLYIPTKDGYINHILSRTVSTERNADVWRLSRAFWVDDKLENPLQITVDNAEWDMALKIVGRPDFIGGWMHGDELMTDIKFVIDGKRTDISSLDDKISFENLKIYENSIGYDPSSPETPVLRHYKEYTVDHSGIRLDQKVEWLGDFDVEHSYLAMMPPKKEITDHFYTNLDTTPKKIDFTSGDRTSSSATSVTVFGESSGYYFTMEVNEYTTYIKPYMSISDNGGGPYNKMYFGFVNKGSVVKGDVWQTMTKYIIEKK